MINNSEDNSEHDMTEADTKHARSHHKETSEDTETCIFSNYPHESFRVGTVQFLNAAPLVWNLQKIASQYNASMEVFRDLPSRLASDLLAGEYEVALIPVAEAARNPHLIQISDVCIASKGRVESIKLLSLVPIHKIHRLALDGASRSSAAMVQVYLKDYVKISPEFVALTPEDDLLRKDTGRLSAASVPDPANDQFMNTLVETLRRRNLDAVLVIGDSAMFISPHDSRIPFILDMGLCWTQWMGLPFTYASWFARPGVDTERLSLIFTQVQKNAEIQMDEIIRTEAAKRQLSADFCRDYLTQKIHYHLDREERHSMKIFIKMAQKNNIFPLGSSITFEVNRKKDKMSEI